MMRDIAVSNSQECVSDVVASIGSDDCLIMADIWWGLFCVYHTDCESRCTGLDPAMGTRGSVALRQSRLVQFEQGLNEASDARVIEVSRLMEAHDDRAGRVLRGQSRRVYYRTGKGVSGRKQNKGRGTNEFRRARNPPIVSAGWTMPWRVGDLGRD